MKAHQDCQGGPDDTIIWLFLAGRKYYHDTGLIKAYKFKHSQNSVQLRQSRISKFSSSVCTGAKEYIVYKCNRL